MLVKQLGCKSGTFRNSFLCFVKKLILETVCWETGKVWRRESPKASLSLCFASRMPTQLLAAPLMPFNKPIQVIGTWESPNNYSLSICWKIDGLMTNEWMNKWMNEQMKHIGTTGRYAIIGQAGYGILAHSIFLSSYRCCKGSKSDKWHFPNFREARSLFVN